MMTKSHINGAILIVLPFFLLASGALLLTHQYLYSLLALLAIVVCMELRVRMGYRGTRGWLFAAHLFSSAILLSLLGVLIGKETKAILFATELAFIIMAVTGAMLIRNSWNRRT